MSRSDEYLKEVSGIASRLDRGSIDRAIAIVYDAWKEDRQVLVIGNGGSASQRRLITRASVLQVDASVRRSRKAVSR